MPNITLRVGAVCLLAACNSSESIQPDRTDDPMAAGTHDVTQHGVVDRAAAEAQIVESAAPDWWELHAGPVRELLPRQSSAPDATAYHFGRGDVTFPTQETRIGVELSGFEPWRDGDSIQLISPNAGFSIWAFDTDFAPLEEGATEASNRFVRWDRTRSPLVEPARGDTTYVAQMTDRVSADNTHYAVMTRATMANGFAVADGQASTLAATLSTLAPDRTVALHYRATEFAALASQAGPNTSPAADADLAIKTLPEPLASNNSLWRSYYMYLPTLVEVWGAAGQRDFDETIHYGSPFHGDWTDVVTLEYPMVVHVPGVGGMTARIVQATRVDALASVLLSPALSPVRNPQIDGHSLDAPVTGIGHGATVTWDAPVLGTATNYSVTVQQIVRIQDGYQIKPVATFYTRQSSLRLPTIATEHASSYLLTITAISSPGRDLTLRPLLGSLPFASTDYVSARITP
ncbi:MAG TPA: hypothetical protein VGG74_06630 [Kofleriaceae bacterium]